MGATKEMFVNMRMREDQYADLPQGIRNKMEIRNIDEDKPDYSDDPVWVNLRAMSTKAWKQLKKYEYELRQKENKDEK